MIKDLRDEVWRANLDLVEFGLVILSYGWYFFSKINGLIYLHSVPGIRTTC